MWQDSYSRGSRFDIPEFDLLAQKVDVLGGYDGRKHPRGSRWAFREWDFPGLVSAVQVDGTLNNPNDVDQGWSVEVAFPWEGMSAYFGAKLPVVSVQSCQ